MKTRIIFLILIFLLFINEIVYNKNIEHFIDIQQLYKIELKKLTNIENKHKKYPKKHIKIMKLLSKTDCQLIIHEALEYANTNGWETKRHEHYPTTDFELDHLPLSLVKITHKINDVIFPTISQMFDVKKENLFLRDLFIVKYETGQQVKLKKHKDGSIFSFIISLNDDFEGGGTNIHKKIYKPSVGSVMIFSGQLNHSGHPITKGKRYIITGFVNIDFTSEI
tara:strand:+ start:7454 stop:8122 length:669 start_codon:yes stop_codon:yes gene_type:complete